MLSLCGVTRGCLWYWRWLRSNRAVGCLLLIIPWRAIPSGFIVGIGTGHERCVLLSKEGQMVHLAAISCALAHACTGTGTCTRTR